MRTSLRVEFAMALLVLFGFLSIVPNLSDALAAPRHAGTGRDIVTRFGRRIDSIRHELPSDGAVGFLSEPPEDQWTNPVYTREIVMSRYFLAPLLVLPDDRQPLVIGSFHGAPPPQLLESRGLTVVKDYGAGVLLLARRVR